MWSCFVFSERPLTCQQYYPDDEDDYENGWQSHSGIDHVGASTGPFTAYPGFNFDPGEGAPETFFDAIFEERMYGIISHETNRYATYKQHGKFYSILFLKSSTSSGKGQILHH